MADKKHERSFAITVTMEDVDQALADGNIDQGQRLTIMTHFTEFVGYLHEHIENEQENWEDMSVEERVGLCQDAHVSIFSARSKYYPVDCAESLTCDAY